MIIKRNLQISMNHMHDFNWDLKCSNVLRDKKKKKKTLFIYKPAVTYIDQAVMVTSPNRKKLRQDESKTRA
jgi:hypothetical protein